LVNGSKTEYEMKKMVSVSLYWFELIFRSLVRPTIFAFPILVLARVNIVGPTCAILMYVPIEEGDKVQQTQPGYQAEIELPQKLAIL